MFCFSSNPTMLCKLLYLALHENKSQTRREKSAKQVHKQRQEKAIWLKQ